MEPGKQKAEIGTDLLLRFCLQRRGMALHMASLVSYTKHEELVELLMSEYLRSPPEGWRALTLDQLARADREFFRLLAERCRGGVKAIDPLQRPMEIAWREILSHPSFRMLLLPIQGGGRARDGAATEEPPTKKTRGDQARLENTIQQLKAENQRLRQQTGGPGSGKGSGGGALGKRGKGRGQREWGPSMPEGLRGKAGTDAEGKRICFDFNFPKDCGKAPPGEECTRGRHVCAERGCFKSHSLQEHA